LSWANIGFSADGSDRLVDALFAWGEVAQVARRVQDHHDVPNLDRVERLPDASHWVHHDEAERVNQLLIDFFAPALPAENR
jgi:pimeloyl-ACP methyl ester carboxylesterase